MAERNLDFDRIINRKNTDCLKYDFAVKRGMPADVLPLWVADMDFAAPPVVIDALQRRIAHGVFGYTEAWPSLVEAVVEGLQREHAWTIEPDWLVWLPGVVSGFNLACAIAGEAGDFSFAEAMLSELGISPTAHAQAQVAALQWASQINVDRHD